MTFITYLGSVGSYSYFAAKSCFGESATYIDTKSAEEIFENLISGKARYAVLPVENSTSGVISQHQELITKHGPTVCNEIVLPIQHQLLGVTSNIKLLKKIFAHPQAFAQCKVFLNSLNNVEFINYDDNGSAAKFVSTEANPAFAAIASRETAKLFWLTVIEPDIQDDPSNKTKFLVLEKS